MEIKAKHKDELRVRINFKSNWGEPARVGFANVGKDNTCSMISSCREDFHGIGNFDFVFVHTTKQREGLFAFIELVEQPLIERGYTPTKFGPTNHDRASWFSLGSFWRQSRFHHSVFTALCKAGRNYNPSNRYRRYDSRLATVLERSRYGGKNCRCF